jgi:hypothetical protein
MNVYRHAGSGFAALVVLAWAGPVGAASFYTQDLDFDHQDVELTNPVPGEIADLASDYFSDFNVTITLDNANSSSTLGLFNTNCGPDFPGVSCSGNDSDLATGPSFGTDPQGLALIVNGGGSTLNDDRGGGRIIFSFGTPVDVKAVRLLDIDEAEGTTDAIDFRFEFADSRPALDVFLEDLGTSNVNNLSSTGLTGDNSFYEYTFDGIAGTNANGDFEGVTQFSVEYQNISGAIAGLTYDRFDIPVPASLPLMLSGLGLLGWMGWRRRGGA